MRRTALILVALCWVSLAGSARASFITYEYVTDKAVYTPLTNQTFAVNLYLQETVTGGNASLIAAEGGLFGAGLFAGEVGFEPAGGKATTITGILPNNAPEPAGFTGTGASGATPTTAYLSESVNINYTGAVGPSGTTAGGSVTSVGGTTTTRVFLGRLTLQAGGPGDTTFELLSLMNSSGTPFSGFDGNTLTFTNFYDLDPDNDGSNGAPAYTGADSFVGTGGPTPAFTFDISVAAVPEPASLTLFLAGFSGLGACGAWRRRRRLGRAPSSPEAARAARRAC